MQTNYAEPIALHTVDTRVPLADFESLHMLWTLRAMRPERDDFETISFAIQQLGSSFIVAERLNGMCTSEVLDGFSLTKIFEGDNAREEALTYFMEMVRSATPPCAQGALPGLLTARADYIETYVYNSGYNGAPCAQSHARVGGWS